MTDSQLSRRNVLRSSAVMAGAFGAGTHQLSGPTVPGSPGGAAHNVEAVGYSDLEHRPGFKMAIRQKGGRWYLYMGHVWHSGWSVVDVTDPTRPEVAAFVPGPVDTWTLQVDLSGDLMVTALEKVFPNFGGDPIAAFEEGIYLWDIADPVRPKQLGHFRTGGSGTHRNHYPGGRYAHLAAGMPGYRGNIYVAVDISNPAAPTEAGRWWVPGQHAAGGEPASAPRDRQDGHLDFPTACCSSGHDVSLHGPAYIDGRLAYLPYGGAGMIVLDISDIARPRQVGHLSFSPPFHSRFGVHSVLPLPQHGIAFVNSEHTTYADGATHHASVVDIRDPTSPYLLSLFPEPVPPPGAPYADFATRGGWRGPHNINHNQHHPDVQPQGDLFYIAHFNAGLRIYDVSNPRLVRETGYFLPPQPTRRYGPMPEDALVTQTEDVVVDRRGFIYITDKNQGLWILRYTGPQPRR
ncbi:Uncharacterized conserved protein [Nocardia amikacinitolerans]|uniref:Uncharacterized conserved protein n=1 Tax=Nocardia amikacinitolerans TaxID=756689 RepID=A0A285M110_9NOCA|nr:Uncharacterized conserved protein [Nocardia amikacinitolerans]